MEEINIKDVLNYFKSKVSVIILITLIVAIAGCLYALLIQTPMYKSSTTLVLTRVDSNESTTTITQNDINLNKNLVSTYREIVKSRRIINQVISNLNLETNYELLSERISVESVQDTELIKITVNNETPKDAKRIADETASVFSKEIQELYQIKNINVVDEAELTTAPYNINVPKQMIIYLLIGLVLGFGIIFIMYYFDTTLKTVEEVETKIGLPVLGQIPLRNKGRKK